MQIMSINNSQNINSKAKVNFVSEQYLLPQQSIKFIEQKAKTIGSEADKICISIFRTTSFEEKSSKTPIIKDVVAISSQFLNKKTSNARIITEGDIKQRQITAFGAINNYIEQLKFAKNK